MGVLTEYETIRVRSEGEICFIRIHRPEANNTINGTLIGEMSRALDRCEADAKIVVLEGSPEVFCFGADFDGIRSAFEAGNGLKAEDPGPQYDLWLRLALGPFISIAHVRGKANAGGIGFVAACDLVICEEDAVLSLSELLFGLMPACVLPFLIRKIGIAKANYMTLMTQPVSARQACEWGLADACQDNSEGLLRKHLLRLNRLGKPGIVRYKEYLSGLDDILGRSKAGAIDANQRVFSDGQNLEKIARYVNTGRFPWENS